MHWLKTFLLLFLVPLTAQGYSVFTGKPLLIAAAGDSTYDPFIDYSEFQDNVTEQEDVNFFEKGRSLNINVMGGYEAISFNIRQLYGDAPVIGASLGYFFDLNFAVQVSTFFPRPHFNSLLSSSSSFFSAGADFKYYLNKQKLVKSAANIFSPYILFGPFYFRSPNNLAKTNESIAGETPDVGIINTPTPEANPGSPPVGVPLHPNLSQEDLSSAENFDAVGLKIGIGLEIPLIKQTYLGFEVAYMYTNFEFENKDLSGTFKTESSKTSYSPYKTFFDRLIFPDTPQVEGHRFYGDMAYLILIFGVNF